MKISIPLFLFIFLFIACQKNEQHDASVYSADESSYALKSLRLVDSLRNNGNGLEGKFIFNKNNQMALSLNIRSRNVYLIEDFESIKKINKKGRGPGELLQPLIIGFDLGDNLIIFDQSLNRFKYFDKNASEIKSEEFKSDGTWTRQYLGLFDTTHLDLGIVESHLEHIDKIAQSKTIARIVDGKVTELYGSYTKAPAYNSEIAFSKKTTTYANHGLVVQCYRTNYRIDFFDTQTQQLTQVLSIQPKYFTFSKNTIRIADDLFTRRRKGLDQSYVESVYYAQGKVYLFYLRFTMETHMTMTMKGTQFFLFAYDMNTREVIFDDKVDEWLAGVDHDGFVYSIDDRKEYQVIKKYAL